MITTCKAAFVARKLHRMLIVLLGLSSLFNTNNTVPTFALMISLDGGNSGNCTDSEACTYFSDYNKCSI